MRIEFLPADTIGFKVWAKVLFLKSKWKNISKAKLVLPVKQTKLNDQRFLQSGLKVVNKGTKSTVKKRCKEKEKKKN